MGDHRANIKIEAEFHSVKKSCDMWINYFPGSCDGVDDRIIEFFQELYELGMAKYEEIAAQNIKEYVAAQTNNNARQEINCRTCNSPGAMSAGSRCLECNQFSQWQLTSAVA